MILDFKLFAGTLAAALVAGSASFAATYQGNYASGACDINNVSNSTDCELWSGNNSGNKGLNEDSTLFSLSGWQEAVKYEDGAYESDLDGLTYSVTETSGTKGTLTFDFSGTNLDVTEVFVSLKAGNGFAAYLLEDGATTVDYFTGDLTNKKGKAKDLSHLDVYYRGTEVSPVPVPAGLPLALLGLSALGVAGIRRKA
ncbi:hypothetical protein ACMA5I_14405 [Paracoccaceae bacterium GXU_MW_L88]